jgi:hypothetical protein
LLIGAELQPHLLETPEAPLIVNGIGRLQQTNDDVYGFSQHRIELFVGQAEEFFVGDQVTGSNSQDGAATREVIEKSHPFCDVEGMMKRKTDHRRAEADAVGMGGGLARVTRQAWFPTTRGCSPMKNHRSRAHWHSDQRDVTGRTSARDFRQMKRHHKE